MQAVAALLAVIVAAPALWIGLNTYRDQVRVTRAQLESTRLEQRRYEERYAARVSYWDERMKLGGEEFAVVKVQNRSPVPVNRISILAYYRDVAAGASPPRSEWVEYPANAIAPPCSILTFRLRMQVNADRYRDYEPNFSPVVTALRFADTVQWWEFQRNFWTPGVLGGPERLRVDEMDMRMVSRDGMSLLEAWEVPGTRQPAGDCGEGS
ncbi:hypothetical protein [Micromonospora sp. CA-246542]|uniref:hypothetical protein n=1 Tax=Micromonospora sp. CA-246542 TaxID=3239959 RepID=UPI003D8F7DF9